MPNRCKSHRSISHRSICHRQRCRRSIRLSLNKHQSVLQISFPRCKELQAYCKNIWHYMKWACNNYCTYLNSHLLEAPRKYVLHGLVPGLNWAPFWPLPLNIHSSQYLAVSYSGSGFTPNAFLLSGWLLTNVQVNNITTPHDICAHMYIHHFALRFFSSFYTSSNLLGRLADPDPSRRTH